MSRRVKRVLNSFLSGTAAAFLTLALEHYADLTNAVKVGDWASFKVVGLSVVFGTILAGLRAVQSYSTVVPSPEPEEN
jgi:uncharacterized membrane protein